LSKNKNVANIDENTGESRGVGVVEIFTFITYDLLHIYFSTGFPSTKFTIIFELLIEENK
jgi:hypothetical protein